MPQQGCYLTTAAAAARAAVASTALEYVATLVCVPGVHADGVLLDCMPP